MGDSHWHVRSYIYKNRYLCPKFTYLAKYPYPKQQEIWQHIHMHNTACCVVMAISLGDCWYWEVLIFLLHIYQTPGAGTNIKISWPPRQIALLLTYPNERHWHLEPFPPIWYGSNIVILLFDDKHILDGVSTCSSVIYSPPILSRLITLI